MIGQFLARTWQFGLHVAVFLNHCQQTVPRPFIGLIACWRVEMTDVEGVIDQLESEVDDYASGTPSGSEEESDSHPATLPPSSLRFRTPDPRAKVLRKASTDPGKMTKVGSRRGSKYLSESSDDQQCPALQHSKKAPSHKKAKQHEDDGACSSWSTKGPYVGGTPTLVHAVQKANRHHVRWNRPYLDQHLVVVPL